MKALQLKIENYFAKHFPGNENLQILGGTVRLSETQLAEIARKFKISKYQINEAEVMDTTVRPYKRKYFHYTLSYGESSPFWDSKVEIVAAIN